MGREAIPPAIFGENVLMKAGRLRYPRYLLELKITANHESLKIYLFP